ncbi:Lectin-like protein BA14k [Sinorhizobium meliloti CCNWSX0020]|uniref:Lectin-like protein BA14k n=1 Tax=Sinorhizobium meliloti CCNWSX0020 TaxID=1107881 RepID=H0FU19_RHIML|nr:BA14K family protein [Sinorhizobium meliloti]EHK79350.1 Lectin-like protein BA14k [Sinorhizobium meliloti CCNWSX0020]
MNKTIAALGAAALLLLTHAGPASANSLYRPSVTVGNDVLLQEVAHRHGFYVMRGVHYFNGYPGVVVARPGYRFYRGYWFPPAAFATGVIVGQTLAHPVQPARRLTAAHIEWCFDHYRSYRAYDNTYQPYLGPREQCWSPYR